MGLIKTGKLAGFYQPDYADGSIVNLLSSIIHACGGESPHQPLQGLDLNKLSAAKRIVCLVVDGLGVGQLDKFISEGGGEEFLAVHDYQKLSTVFPATTAAAVTTFMTGASPAEHGVLSWHLNLHDLGAVSTILLAKTRTGMPLFPSSFDLNAYLSLPSHLESISIRKELISFGHIPRSRFSLVGTLWDKRSSFRTLGGLHRHTYSFAHHHGGRGLAYVYWPKYDTFCHEYGCYHPITVGHLHDIDKTLGHMCRKLAGTDTYLLILADHGLVDAAPDGCIDLAEVPGFYNCLATLPSGDARAVSCFVRPARVNKFLEIVDKYLGPACICCSGEELLSMGVYGLGNPHPALDCRVGDYVLLALDGYTFSSTLPGADKAFNVANHGGMSPEEVVIPLYAIHC